jgi:glycerate kinase
MSGHPSFLIAPDKFKGSLTSSQVAEHISLSILKAIPSAVVDLCPIADGGDGLLAIAQDLGYQLIEIEVSDAFLKKKKTEIGMKDGRAFIELAHICGIGELREDERDPYISSTYGLGEAALQAVKMGARKITISLGGSASIDGGFGFACGLGLLAYDKFGERVAPNLQGLRDLSSINLDQVNQISKKIEWEVLVDVENVLLGALGAVKVFGKQKGLEETDFDSVGTYLLNWVALLEEKTGRNYAKGIGSGAAGGVAAAVVPLFNSKVSKGSDWFIEKLNVLERIKRSDFVITAEGAFDSQSFMGKVTGEIISAATSLSKHVFVIAGQSEPNMKIREGIDVIVMSELFGSIQASISYPVRWLEEATYKVCEEAKGAAV